MDGIPASELAAWSELAEKATPGKWEANRWRVCAWVRGHIQVVVDTAWNNKSRTPENEANAAFIAASRDALPRLIAAYSQSQARVAELEAAIEKHRAGHKGAILSKRDRALWSVLPQSEGAT